MLTCWGGKDDYQFKFEPEQQTNEKFDEKFMAATDENANNMTIGGFNNNNNTTTSNNNKKVFYFIFLALKLYFW